MILRTDSRHVEYGLGAEMGIAEHRLTLWYPQTYDARSALILEGHLATLSHHDESIELWAEVRP